MNQSDLINLDPLLFLQRLFDSQHLVFRLEIEGLFTPGQRFDENLQTKTNTHAELKSQNKKMHLDLASRQRQPTRLSKLLRTCIFKSYENGLEKFSGTVVFGVLILGMHVVEKGGTVDCRLSAGSSTEPGNNQRERQNVKIETPLLQLASGEDHKEGFNRGFASQVP
jgi:cyclophilin family peptidyl-prolyl cis-trans isomerase